MSLPAEVLQIIFNHLDTSHDGLRTLFSCLLVNRYWCTSITKILWSKPFYYSNAFAANPNPHKIIDTYLSCLDEEVREDLRNKGVNLPIIFNKPLFSYESYHKHLYYRTFISCVYLWVQETRAPCDRNLFEIIIKILLRLFKERCKGIQRTLYIIESEPTKGSIAPMFYVQPEHGYLISNVNRIWVDLHICRPRFFDLLAKNCKRVEQFGVFMKDVGRFNESGSIDVAKFITEQEALQSFQCVYLTSVQNVIDALETQSNSLKCVDFICANFHGCVSLDGLSTCKNLEILRFRKCYNIIEEIVEPLFETQFPKLIDVSVIQTDCNALQTWAERFQDNFQDTTIQFGLDQVRELMLNNKMCHICNELCIFPLTTTCGHTFCKDCILHRLNIYDRCPLKQCRTELSNSRYFYEHPNKPTDAIISERRKLEAERRSLQAMPIYVGHLAFPKMTYTYKVTEQKYKLLIISCLESRYRKKFGMLLSKRCEYGTLMEIKQIDFNSEGDLILQATATDRFKILSNLVIEGDYEVARVQIVEDDDDDDDDEEEEEEEEEEEGDSNNENSSSVIIREPTTTQLIKTAHDFIHGNELVSLMLRLCDSTSSFGEIPEGAADFSFHVASILPVKDEERYELLGTRSKKERMRLVVMWINYLRSQWCTLVVNRIRNRSILYVIYSWIIASLQDFCTNYFFYRN